MYTARTAEVPLGAVAARAGRAAAVLVGGDAVPCRAAGWAAVRVGVIAGAS